MPATWESAPSYSAHGIYAPIDTADYDSARAALRAVARLYGAAALLPLTEYLQLNPFTDDIVFFRGVDSHVIFAAARQIFLGMTAGRIFRIHPDWLVPAAYPACHSEAA